MADTAYALAQSLIATHGTDALAMAEKAAANVFKLHLPDRTARWDRIIAEIKTLQSGDHREVL